MAQFQAEFFVAPDGTVTPKARQLHGAERQKIFDRDGGACGACGREVGMFRHPGWPYSGKPVAHVDHIFPRSRGGQNRPRNLRLLCERCNSSKGAKLEGEWRAWLDEMDQ